MQIEVPSVLTQFANKLKKATIRQVDLNRISIII